MVDGRHPSRFGKYDVVRKLASGGMADVYLCRFLGEEGFEKKVAVKAIRSLRSGEARFRELFVREARIAAALSHPNVVQVFDFGKEGDEYYLVMEFVPGYSLAQAIAQARLQGTPLPLPIWKHWMEGILLGLGYLHSRGIVHRDVSPSNVLLSRGGAVKLMDLGIARRVRDGDGSEDARGGKPGYMAPEVEAGGAGDFRSDLFAAAVVGAEMLASGRRFPAERPEGDPGRRPDPDRELPEIPEVPEPVAKALRKGLAPEREDRYRNADAFLHALDDALPGGDGRKGLQRCWDDLFLESGEESTIVEGPARPAMVRERRGTYGANAKVLGIGVTSALLALSLGGYLAGRRTEVSRVRPPEDAGRNVVAGEVGRARDFGRSGAAPKIAQPDVAHGNGPGEGMSTPVSTEPAGTEMAAGGGKGIVAGPSARPEVSAAPAAAAAPPGPAPVPDAPAAPPTPSVASPLQQAPQPVAGAPKEPVHATVGTIAVFQVVPWAKVYQGDRYLGETPIHDLELPAGENRLRLVNEPMGVDRTVTVRVQPGNNPKVIVPLQGSRQRY